MIAADYSIGILISGCLLSTYHPSQRPVFADKQLNCRDCRNDFVFTASEQEFFGIKGLINEPKRCPACRLIQRGKRAGKEVKLVDVTCADCGVATKVTFVPTGVRPVLCAMCMHKGKTDNPPS